MKTAEELRAIIWKCFREGVESDDICDAIVAALTADREALRGEPVAWLYELNGDERFALETRRAPSPGWTEIPLYAHPPVAEALRGKLRERVIAVLQAGPPEPKGPLYRPSKHEEFKRWADAILAILPPASDADRARAPMATTVFPKDMPAVAYLTKPVVKWANGVVSGNYQTRPDDHGTYFEYVPRTPPDLAAERRGAEADRERLEDLLGAELSGAYDCTRVWEAWGVGTMRQDDFVPLSERIPEIADAILAIFTPAGAGGRDGE